MKAISFLKMNSTFLTYPFSSKFHLFIWPLLGPLGQNSGAWRSAACLKRWEMTNTLTNYLSGLAISVVLHAFWSDLPALMNSPLVEAVRAILVVLQGVENQWWLLQWAVPKPCLLLAWAGEPGREPAPGRTHKIKVNQIFPCVEIFFLVPKQNGNICMLAKFCAKCRSDKMLLRVNQNFPPLWNQSILVQVCALKACWCVFV